MKHAAVIASKGRPDVLRDTLESIWAQSRAPDQVVIVVERPDDLLDGLETGKAVRVVIGDGGVTRTLNLGVAACGADIGTVSLFDDDIELAPDYLERALELFAGRPDVLMFDGQPVHAGPCDRAEARRSVAGAGLAGGRFCSGVPVWGCNMNVRRAVFGVEQFDEAIVLYGWLREYDFGDRVARLGLTGRHEGCVFAHLAARGGRISDLQYGYTQLMNPVYYRKKGTVVQSWADLVFGHFAKVIGANLLKWVTGDRSCNRLLRLRGNLLAAGAALRGVSDPRSVLEIR
jgi:GT2 family glycosyltransferase